MLTVKCKVLGSRQSQEVAAIAEKTSAGAEEVTATISEQA
ncbi:hypothetical protein QFZ73_002455 [Peribacillus sp. V2I11]|nr:hypothetical protein [Peribacillus sp. V2I11]